MWVRSLGQEHLERGMATHSNILAWRTPWTEEPGRLQSMGSQRVRHDLVTEQQQYTYVDRHRLIPPAVAGPSFGGSRVLVYFHGCVQSLSHVQLFVIQWTIACQASLSCIFVYIYMYIKHVYFHVPTNFVIVSDSE